MCSFINSRPQNNFKWNKIFPYRIILNWILQMANGHKSLVLTCYMLCFGASVVKINW